MVCHTLLLGGPMVSGPLWRIRALGLRWDSSEFQVALALFAYLGGIAVVFATGNYSQEQQHLGAENFNIALAILDGRGFSDPFGEQTGSTAWMPPLYPFLLAAGLAISGSKAIVSIGVLSATTLVLTACGTWLFRVARSLDTAVPPVVCPVLFAVWVSLQANWYFALTTDVWLLTALVTSMSAALFAHVHSRRTSSLAWGLLGGLAASSSPTLMVAWGLMGLWFFATAASSRRSWVRAGLIAAMLAAPWGIRNTLLFGKFIPSKSNLAFEFYQANVFDEDGIYDEASMSHHPYNQLSLRAEYASLGEVNFVKEKGDKFFDEALGEPVPYFRRVFNRLRAVTLEYHPGFVGEDRSPLYSVKRFVHALPTWAVLCGLLFGARRHGRVIVAFLAFGGLALLPYVMVAFYMRYLIPLAPVLVLLVFCSTDRVVAATAAIRRQGVSP